MSVVSSHTEGRRPVFSSRLPRRSFLISLAASGLAGACGGGESSPPAPGISVTTAATNATLANASGNGGALVGVVWGHVNATQTDLAPAGVRRLGQVAAVTNQDMFIIGSNTKAMTAALAAALVEADALSWDTTMVQALPGLAPTMHAVWQTATLSQLLDHQSGLPAYTADEDFVAFASQLATLNPPNGLSQTERRGVFAKWLLEQAPADGRLPGKQFYYSNAGYVLAAYMLETISGQSFQSLFTSHLGAPLGISGVWLRPELVSSEQPLGYEGPEGKLQAVPLLDAADQAWLDVIAPAGLFATSPVDYATWLRWHILGLQGKATPLAPSYLQRLRTLKHGQYALGWICLEKDGHAMLAHDGHWGGFMALVAVAQNGHHAEFALTNTASQDSNGSWVLRLLNELLIEVDRHYW